MTDRDGRHLVIDLNTRVTGTTSLGLMKGYFSVERAFNDAAIFFPLFLNVGLEEFKARFSTELEEWCHERGGQSSVTIIILAGEDEKRLEALADRVKALKTPGYLSSLSHNPRGKRAAAHRMVSPSKTSSAIRQGTTPINDQVPRGQQRVVVVEEREGFDAWLQALGAFLVYTATWGLLSAYGSYEKYYETTMLASTPSTTIAWVDTLQGVILILGGIVTGPIFDRGYIRELLIIGTITTRLGLMMPSLAHEYYQILLAQDVCVGNRERDSIRPQHQSDGIEISATSSVGSLRRHLGNSSGIIYPIIFSDLQPKLGFA
ncbi:hypothetical protein DL767_007622 [Monosporascus sp. MG133]|nr:hypothetical protein DL767_007622 [Monosporascus sp. MG133]